MSNSLAVPGFLDAIAILFGALTGAMAATRRGLDWFGVLIVAFCTGVGGGIIRDILLQNGVPALLSNPRYQLYATIGAIVGLFFAKGAARLIRFSMTEGEREPPSIFFAFFSRSVGLSVSCVGCCLRHTSNSYSLPLRGPYVRLGFTKNTG